MTGTTPNPLQPFVEHHKICILDGGFATHLSDLGFDIDDPLWSAKALIDAPELVELVHLNYLEAGADVVISASYQASFDGFAARGMDRQQSASLMRLSVELARNAVERTDRDGPTPVVAASVGPYGAYLADGSEYSGDYGVGSDRLHDFHSERLGVLVSAGPDLLAIETIPSLPETEVLVELLRDHPDMPAWITFSCRDGAHISDGTGIGEAVAVAGSAPNVIGVGVNCTDPAYITSILENAASDKPLVCYPNAGGGKRVDGEWRWNEHDPGSFTSAAAILARRGRPSDRWVLRDHAGRHREPDPLALPLAPLHKRPLSRPHGLWPLTHLGVKVGSSHARGTRYAFSQHRRVVDRGDRGDRWHRHRPDPDLR